MRDNRKQPKSARPAYAMQRERLGEWAAVLCIALFVFLSFSWPTDLIREKPASPLLPGTSASYVQVVFPEGIKSVIPRYYAQRIDASGGTFSLLPKQIPPPLPPVPTNVFEALPPPATPSVPVPRMSYRQFSIEYPAMEYPVYGENANTNNLYANLSADLVKAGFTFSPPKALPPVRFTCIVDLTPGGRVRTLLINGGETPVKALLPWRRALLSGHAKTNGYGRIKIETRLPSR